MDATSGRRSGIAPVEIAIVAGILALMGLLVVPALRRYVRLTKTSEAFVSLNRIEVGAVAYHRADHFDATGQPVPRQFPGTDGPVPGTPCWNQPQARCAGRDPGWTNATWRALRFSMENSHYYTYAFSSAGFWEYAQYTATARGNLDGDGIVTTFQSHAGMQPDGGIHSVLWFFDDETE